MKAASGNGQNAKVLSYLIRSIERRLAIAKDELEFERHADTARRIKVRIDGLEYRLETAHNQNSGSSVRRKTERFEQRTVAGWPRAPASTPGLRSCHPARLERPGQPFDVVQGDIAFGALDSAHECAVKPRLMGQALLVQTESGPPPPKIGRQHVPQLAFRACRHNAEARDWMRLRRQRMRSIAAKRLRSRGRKMRLAIAGLLALTACASGPSRLDVATATMHQASAACAARLAQLGARGMTRLGWEKCNDDALRTFAIATEPQFIDLENERFAKNALIAAEYDAGKLSNDEADALIAANDAAADREKTESIRPW